VTKPVPHLNRGGWCRLSDKVRDQIEDQNEGVSVEDVPYFIHGRSQPPDDDAIHIEIHSRMWAVSVRHAYPVDPPQVSLAEKERLRIQSEPWVKRRDQNLKDVFQPPLREAPAPKPAKPRPKPVPYDGADYSISFDQIVDDLT